jgi:hypothetical protein
LEFIFLDYYRRGEDAARAIGLAVEHFDAKKPPTTKGTKDHKGLRF